MDAGKKLDSVFLKRNGGVEGKLILFNANTDQTHYVWSYERMIMHYISNISKEVLFHFVFFLLVLNKEVKIGFR